MVSKTKEIYKKIHLDQTEEKPSSEDENSFMSQFNHQALPMFIIKPVGTPQKKRVEKSEKIKQQDSSQSTKVDPALKEIQKRLPSEFNQAIQIQQIIPSLDPQHHHQIDYSKNQHDKTREDKYDHKIERDHRSEKSEDYRNEREKEHKYRKDTEQNNLPVVLV
ncbi:MAG: hypothetical protein EZS28_020989 [Streblomastix strix]|uniref:Uncharacterized protein n=1 Tax=Streblomastix strix TaxID=222440 RepID=A0A5J4VLM8_9EUKA|nr:MAG: hypothetical protein EZS28_020989 [Streblomastix strix]